MRLVDWLEDETGRVFTPDDLGGGFVGLTADLGDGYTVTVTYGDYPIDTETPLAVVDGDSFVAVFSGPDGFSRVVTDVSRFVVAVSVRWFYSVIGLTVGGE